MAVALGLDWVVIDAEHGHLDWKEIVEHLRAAVRSETVALVRVADLDRGLIKRALDVGADGVVVPWVETAEQLRQAVAFARYPPEGCRGHRRRAGDGLGRVPGRAHGRGQRPRPRRADHRDRPRRGGSAADVRGRGRRDLLLRPGRLLGHGRLSRPVGRARASPSRFLALKDTIRAAGKHCGVVATGTGEPRRAVRPGLPHARPRARRRPAAPLAARVAGRGRPRPQDPRRASASRPDPAAPPLARPPESMRPDRPEVMTAVGSGDVAGDRARASASSAWSARTTGRGA